MLEKIGLPAKPSLRGNSWVVDASHCQGCSSQFTFINRKHHCRRCGGLFCGSCTQQRMSLRGQGDAPVRICEPCKKLEEAARFELRHGYKNRAVKAGSSKRIVKNEDDVLSEILGSDVDVTSSSESVSSTDRVTSKEMASSSSNKDHKCFGFERIGCASEVLFSLLISDAQPLCGKENFEESLNKVVEMGFDPTSPRFVQALKVVYGFNDKSLEQVNVCKRLVFAVGDVWAMFMKCPMFLKNSEKKVCQRFETLKKYGLLEDEVLSVFKKFPQCIGVSEKKIASSIETFLGLGFSGDEFAMMVKRFPQCLTLSAETLKKKTEFVLKKMNWPLKALVSTPAVLGYSVEKRTIPRCNVIKALMSKGLME